MYKAIYHESVVAVKELKDISQKELSNFFHEAHTMMYRWYIVSYLNRSIQSHKNVVTFIGYCQKPPCLVTGTLDLIIDNEYRVL